MVRNTTLLGGLTAKQFLQWYWQKKPLLIRNAFPHFQSFLTKNQLISLSGREDAQARLIHSYRNQWDLQYGPFKKSDFAKLPDKWTLLVQDIQHFLPEAHQLLSSFNFIPYTRLDDLMISFATDGGGVGPHVDSYDVFLLQGMGKRLWQISGQDDQRLLPNTPLRILKNFKPEQEWVLEPGDMLYLPPNYAHNGVAVGECLTYSIGFRAPAYQELAREFLTYLQDQLEIPGIYADPTLKLAKYPAHISEDMLDQVTTKLSNIRFGKKEISRFLGSYLSEPKTHVFFEPPQSPLSKQKFLKLAQQQSIQLDLKSQMLFTTEAIFMNGETYLLRELDKPLLKKLANQRQTLIPNGVSEDTASFLYQWYLSGYVVFDYY